MVFDLIDRHRFEGPNTNMERNGRETDPSLLQPCQQLRCEMEPGSRRRNSAFMLREQGLVPFSILVGRRPFHVGWKRHSTILSQPFRQRNRALDPNRRSGRATLDHHSRSLCAHLNNLSKPERSLDQHFPDRIAKILHKKDLDLRTGRTLPSNHARSQHLRIVDHEEIAGLKKIGQLVDTAMGE